MTSLEKLREEFKLATATFGPRERIATRWLYHSEPVTSVVSMFQLNETESLAVCKATSLLFEANADYDRVYDWSNALGEVKL